MRLSEAGWREEGQVLILVLVFLVMFGVIAGLLLSQAGSSFVLNVATQNESKLLYGADGGLDYWLKQPTVASTVECPSSMANGASAPAKVTEPTVRSVTVTCTQVSGPGSNLFGGYAVVTGVGYPSTTHAGSVASHEGHKTCDSLSVDPVDPGKPTIATGTATCPVYATSGSTPPWANEAVNNPPAPTTQLNGVYGIQSSEVFTVGNAAGGPSGHEVIWFFDGDGFTGVATAHNTGALTNANLQGVWAASTTQVWAVGTTGMKGIILNCATNCTSTRSTWTSEALPANTLPLKAVYGTNATHVYAVGKATMGMMMHPGVETVLSYNGTTWAPLGTLSGTSALAGVYAVANYVWVVGNGTLAEYNTTTSTWTTQQLPTTTPALPNMTAISGRTVTGTVHIWLAGGSDILTCTANCTTATPTWVGSTISSMPAPNFDSIVAGNANDVWAVGGTVVAYCTSNCASATPVWTTQGVPMQTGQLNAVEAGPPPMSPASGWSGDAWAVGNTMGATGTFLVYTPVVSNPAPPKVKISGGPVFNAQGRKLSNKLEIDNNFTQEQKPCPTPFRVTGNLTVTGTATCTTTVPTSLKSLTRQFPGYSPTPGQYVTNGPPPPKGKVTHVANTPSGCSLTVLAPGMYAQTQTTKIKFTHTTTYFFESGLYYFTGGFPAFDNGTGPGAPGGTFTQTSDKLYIIGGMPSPGDENTIAEHSPCWSFIEASSYSHAGTGTGVEWILGTNTWMDVHTVNMELFTREGGQAWEGAQGLSIREVPPKCATVGRASPGPGPSCITTAQANEGWKTSDPGTINQLFQVDASQHHPHVFVHGGLYAPDNDIEEFTNTSGVILGPIDCDSLELSFESTASPELQIEAGTGTPTVALKSTAYGPGSPLSEEVVYGHPATNATESPRVLYWSVCKLSKQATVSARRCSADS